MAFLHGARTFFGFVVVQLAGLGLAKLIEVGRIWKSSRKAVLTALALRKGSIYAAKEGGSEEMKKALITSAFFVWAMCVSKLLLADAEVGEDVVEDGVTGDLTSSDFAESADREAKVRG